MWPDGPYSNMYLYMDRPKRRPYNKRDDAPKQCQQTCPCCGRKMVNIYLKDDEWKCKQCWDKLDEQNGQAQ